MKKSVKSLSMAVLAFMAAMLTGCTNDDLAQSENNGRVITATTTVNIGGSDTRALSEDGKKTFEVGDKVGMRYQIPGSTYSMAYVTSEALTAADISSDKKSATLTFTLTNPMAGGDVDILYPITNLDATGKPNLSAYLIQDGTFANVQALELSSFQGHMDDKCNLPPDIQLYNEWAIAKFTVKNANGQDITNTITSLTVQASNSNAKDTYTVNRTAAAGPIYLVMAQDNDPLDITITASDGTEFYQKSVTGKPIKAGNIYPINVTAIKVTDRIEPLTFEAKEAGAVVKFLLQKSLGGVQYSTDGSTWSDYPSNQEITLANVGDKVMFRGNNAAYGTTASGHSNFSCSDDCYIYGNVMSLIHPTSYATLTSLTADFAFYKLFADNTHMVNHANKPLVLPATTITKYCYGYMFSGCTGLTKAPALPAETLAANCYYEMFFNCSSLTTAPDLDATRLAERCYYGIFDGCTSLTTGPALPAETLATGCYYGMFDKCSGLTKAPVLPAETLESGCYGYMFNLCTSLQTAPALPATTLAGGCYMYMFNGCSGLTTAPALPATTLFQSSYANMFQGCSSLQKAPDLPATTLAAYCYDAMFKNCTQLNSVKCMATDISASNCTRDWLKNVASTGTVTAASAGIWTRDSESGIPTGWNVVQAASTNGGITDYTLENGTLW